jgi:Kef-type K+ transport system membrane component KefB
MSLSLQSPVVPPLTAHTQLVFLLELFLLLGLAVLLGQLGKRVGMPPVVGELCAGVIMGPSVLEHADPRLFNWLMAPHNPSQLHLVDAVGEFGVVLFVGLTGISMDVGMLRRKAAKATGVGAGALIIPLACGAVFGYLLPKSMMASGASRVTFVAFIAVAMCVSAIPVIAKTLMEMNLLHRNIGQLIMSAATFDDVIGWLLFSIVSLMAVSGVHTGRVLEDVGWVALLFIGCFTIGRPIAGYTLRFTGRLKDPGPSMAAVVLMILIVGATSQSMGMEAIIGALLAGMVIASTNQIDLRWMSPLRTMVTAVLAPVFFATAGLRMDLATLGHPTVAITAVLFLVIALVTKFAGAYIGARGVRLDHWTAVALGAGLNARGVMEIILATIGLRQGVLTTSMYTVIVLVAIITSVMAPPILRYAMARTEAITPEEIERELLLTGESSEAADQVTAAS